MRDLNRYKKRKARPKGKISSIEIDPKHGEFIKRHNLNLSMLVRELLDDLIKEWEKSEKRYLDEVS